MSVSPEVRSAEGQELFEAWTKAREANLSKNPAAMVEVFDRICDKLDEYIPATRLGDEDARRIANAWDELRVACAGLVPVDETAFPEGMLDDLGEYQVDWDEVYTEIRYNFPMVEAAKMVAEGHERDFAEVMVALQPDEEHLSDRVQSLPLMARALAQAGIGLVPWEDDDDFLALVSMSEVRDTISIMKNMKEAEVNQVDAAVTEAFRVSRMAHADIVDYAHKTLGMHATQFDAEAISMYAEAKQSALRLDLAQIALDLTKSTSRSVSESRISDAFRDAELLRLAQSMVSGVAGKADIPQNQEPWQVAGLTRSNALAIAALGIPLAVIPDATFIRQLSRARGPLEKILLLSRNRTQILASCGDLANRLQHTMYSEAQFIKEAIDSMNVGHEKSAQALATNIMDSELTRIRKILLGSGSEMTVGEFSAIDITERYLPSIPQNIDMTSVAVLLATAKAFYHGVDAENDWGTERFPVFHRNMTSHNVNGRQYNALNATLAIMMACATTLERSRWDVTLANRVTRRAA